MEPSAISLLWAEYGLSDLVEGNEIAQGSISPPKEALMNPILRQPRDAKLHPLPYVSAMVGRYGTIPREKRVACASSIDRLADPFAGRDHTAGLNPVRQVERREQELEQLTNAVAREEQKRRRHKQLGKKQAKELAERLSKPVRKRAPHSTNNLSPSKVELTKPGDKQAAPPMKSTKREERSRITSPKKSSSSSLQAQGGSQHNPDNRASGRELETILNLLGGKEEDEGEHPNVDDSEEFESDFIGEDEATWDTNGPPPNLAAFYEEVLEVSRDAGESLSNASDSANGDNGVDGDNWAARWQESLNAMVLGSLELEEQKEMVGGENGGNARKALLGDKGKRKERQRPVEDEKREVEEATEQQLQQLLKEEDKARKQQQQLLGEEEEAREQQLQELLEEEDEARERQQRLQEEEEEARQQQQRLLGEEEEARERQQRGRERLEHERLATQQDAPPSGGGGTANTLNDRPHDQAAASGETKETLNSGGHSVRHALPPLLLARVDTSPVNGDKDCSHGSRNPKDKSPMPTRECTLARYDEEQRERELLLEHKQQQRQRLQQEERQQQEQPFGQQHRHQGGTAATRAPVRAADFDANVPRTRSPAAQPMGTSPKRLPLLPPPMRLTAAAAAEDEDEDESGRADTGSSFVLSNIMSDADMETMVARDRARRQQRLAARIQQQQSRRQEVDQQQQQHLPSLSDRAEEQLGLQQPPLRGDAAIPKGEQEWWGEEGVSGLNPLRKPPREIRNRVGNKKKRKKKVVVKDSRPAWGGGGTGVRRAGGKRQGKAAATLRFAVTKEAATDENEGLGARIRNRGCKGVRGEPSGEAAAKQRLRAVGNTKDGRRAMLEVMHKDPVKREYLAAAKAADAVFADAQAFLQALNQGESGHQPKQKRGDKTGPHVSPTRVAPKAEAWAVPSPTPVPLQGGANRKPKRRPLQNHKGWSARTSKGGKGKPATSPPKLFQRQGGEGKPGSVKPRFPARALPTLSKHSGGGQKQAPQAVPHHRMASLSAENPLVPEVVKSHRPLAVNRDDDDDEDDESGGGAFFITQGGLGGDTGGVNGNEGGNDAGYGAFFLTQDEEAEDAAPRHVPLSSPRREVAAKVKAQATPSSPSSLVRVARGRVAQGGGGGAGEAWGDELPAENRMQSIKSLAANRRKALGDLDALLKGGSGCRLKVAKGASQSSAAFAPAPNPQVPLSSNSDLEKRQQREAYTQQRGHVEQQQLRLLRLRHGHRAPAVGLIQGARRRAHQGGDPSV